MHNKKICSKLSVESQPKRPEVDQGKIKFVLVIKVQMSFAMICITMYYFTLNVHIFYCQFSLKEDQHKKDFHKDKNHKDMDH